MDLLLKHIIDYAIVCDAEGQIRFVNPALRRALGYDDGESLDLSNLFDKSTHDILRNGVRTAADLANASPSLRISCQRKNGESLELVGPMIPIGNDGEFVGLFNDQGHPRDTGKQLEAILEAIPDVLIVFDREGRYRHVFTANNELLVESRAHLLGRTMHEMMHEEEARPGLELISRVIETGKPAEAVHRLTIKDKARWFSIRVVPIEDEGENCALWLSRDVTETVVARKKRAANHQLLQELLRIQERERQLLANELHDGFVQDVVGARMWLESVERDWKVQPEIAKEALAVVRKSIDQAVIRSRELVNGLRPVLTDHSGIEAGVRALVDQFDRQTAIQVRFRTTGDVGPLFPLLESAIIRICQEALNNVVRHSQANVATVQLARAGEMVRLVVEDDGVGFDADKFQQEPSGVESIIRRAEVFGGRARMETVPGTGTKIIVSLPALPLGEDNTIVTQQLSSIMLDNAELKVTGDSPDV